MIAAAIAYTLWQNARRRDVAWVFGAVAIAVVASRLGASVLGSTLGGGLASLAVGLAGNLYSRYLHHPKSTLTVPGLTVLVPGVLGLEGAFSMVSGASQGGTQLIVDALLLAAALVVGLMIAESIVAPRTLPEHIEAGDALPRLSPQPQRSAPQPPRSVTPGSSPGRSPRRHG